MNQILDKLEQIHGSVSVVGSMNADYTVTTERLPGPGETVTGGPLQVLPGGKSGNQAAAAAKLGATVRMFGAVGSDSNADFLLTQLASAGVNTDGIRKVLGPSGTTVITVDSHGENTIVYSPGSNANVTVEYIESQRDLLTASSVLGLCLESPLETVTACATMCQLVQLLHIDEPEDDDWDSFDWAQAQNRLSEFGFDQAIVTLGGDGSVVLDSTVDPSIIRIAPVRVDAVDTTGCGDSFMGTVLASLASGLSLEESAQLASYVSAYAATGYGAQASYGTAAQIRERFR